MTARLTVHTGPGTSLTVSRTYEHTVTVHDDDAGGIWRPSEEAGIDIDASDDPLQRAAEICRDEPHRGTWYA